MSKKKKMAYSKKGEKEISRIGRFSFRKTTWVKSKSSQKDSSEQVEVRDLPPIKVSAK